MSAEGIPRTVITKYKVTPLSSKQQRRQGKSYVRNKDTHIRVLDDMHRRNTSESNKHDVAMDVQAVQSVACRGTRIYFCMNICMILVLKRGQPRRPS